MVIGDDHVEAVILRPVEWLMRADAAVDADDEFVTIGDGFFEGGLLNAVAFGEAMWNVKAGVRAEEFQRAQEHCCSGCAIDVVITVDQDRLARLDRALQASDGLLHPEHGIRLVQLIVSWREEDARGVLVDVPAIDEKSSQDW